MIRAAIIAVCGLLAGCSADKTNDPANPSAYAVRLVVTPDPARGLQRASVPAEALAALRSPDRSDIRIFDADGMPLTMARAAAPTVGAVDIIWLEALPFLGPPGPAVAESSELRVVRRVGAESVTIVDGGIRSAMPVAIGAFFDTRSIEGAVRTIRLDARLPAQRPVSFEIEGSDDLANWTRVGGRTIYRKDADTADALGPETISLDPGYLKSRYLRVKWSAPHELPGSVEIKGAFVGIARKPGSDPRPSIVTSLPNRLDAHDVRFALARPIELAALAIAPIAGEQVAPVRIFGRNAADQGWTPLGAGNLRGPTSQVIGLSGGAFAEYRITVDRRTVGFAAAPRLRLVFAPIELVALFDGRPPFTLAAGAERAESRFLEIERLIPRYRPGAEASLPQATVAPSPGARVELVKADDRLFTRKKALLWGLLLLGVAALGFMVWRLWRPGAYRDGRDGSS